MARGAERCQALLATETTRVLLHGDLHLAITRLRRPGSQQAVGDLLTLARQ